MSRDADAISPSLTSRRFHAAALVVTVAALAASVGIKAVADPRPLDVQLTDAISMSGDALQAWHGHLSRGLQVSLRAVADGQEVAPVGVTGADVQQRVAAAVDSSDDRDPPVPVQTPLPQAPEH